MFNRGVGGAFFVLLWLASSVAAAAATGTLYLNDEPLSLEHPIIQQGMTLLVPLEEFASRLGLEVSETEGRVVLRGDGFRQALDQSVFLVQDGTTYVSLEWILGLAGGEIHRVGNDVYVESHGPTITAVEATQDHVAVRLTGFCAHTATVSEQGASDVMLLQWPDCTLGISAQRIRVGTSGVQEVRLIESSSGVELSVWLEAGTVLATQELETGGAYVLTLSITETPSDESIVEAADGMKVHELTEDAGRLTIDYAYVESWRDDFRLIPTVPSSGYESESSLVDVLKDNDAVCSVPLDCPVESTYPSCLVMNGIPYRVPDGPTEVLAIDLFGRWTTFSSGCSVSVKYAGQLIPVDGVNRPLGYGEIVSYAPGYSGRIARGLPGSFLALKIRDDRVVSVYQGPFVPNDTSAILIVASGDATAKLAAVQLGDPIEVVCQFPQAGGTYRHVVSSGPMVLSNGSVDLDDEERQGMPHLSGAVVLACDWQGGLYLLTVAETHLGDSDEGSWNLIDVLRSLPTTIKDAILLSSCARSSLAYAGVSGPFQLGSQDPIQLALSLVPTSP